MLSICITVKNRSCVQVGKHRLQLFPHCVESLRVATPGLPCEIVITDWQSDDWPLADWLPQWSQGLDTKVVPMEGSFCRGRGRNAAAEHARGEHLFFLDADCLVHRSVLETGLRMLTEGQSYFPIVYSYSDASHGSGWWRSEGFGNCMLSRPTFEKSGGWPQYQTWGKEDDDFYDRVRGCSSVVRENAPGLIHQWHPEEMAWKDRFREDEEIRRVRHAIASLWTTVPIGESLILVDDGQFGGHEKGFGRTVLPFVEREGVYWGPPDGDEAAIVELERLKNKGGRFLAFAWVSFWWLQYYSQFAAFISEQYNCCLASDDLVVFDLHSGRQSITPALSPKENREMICGCLEQ